MTPLSHRHPSFQRTRRRVLGRVVSPGIVATLAAGTALLTCSIGHADDAQVLDVTPASVTAPVAPAAKAIPARTPTAPTASVPLPAAPARRTLVIGERRAATMILPRELRPTEAFHSGLRSGALASRRAQLYADLPPEMPELLEDDFILRERARAAESVIGSAVEKALVVAFNGGVRHESSLSVRPEFTTVDHGFRIDASPSWSYKVRSLRSGLRFDLPLTPRPVRVHAWRELRGTDHVPMRLGGGISLDPFDQSIRCGVTLEF